MAMWLPSAGLLDGRHVLAAFVQEQTETDASSPVLAGEPLANCGKHRRAETV